MNDQVWQRMSEAITAAKHSKPGARGQQSKREFIEALVYLIRIGAPRRDLPKELGYWHAIYMRFHRWEDPESRLATDQLLKRESSS